VVDGRLRLSCDNGTGRCGPVLCNSARLGVQRFVCYDLKQTKLEGVCG